MPIARKVKSNDDIFKSTSEIVKRLIESGRTELQKCAKFTFDVLSLTEIPTSEDITELKLIPNDMIEIALNDIHEGFTPLILNPCNDQQACGEWDIGKEGIEENIAYCSTLSASVVDGDMFPLRSDEGLYSPDVYVFRDPSFRQIKSQRVSVVSIAPMKRPDFSVENDLTKVTNKLESVWLCAIANNHDSIILPTFGCDTEDNDPVEIAKIIKKLFNTYKNSGVNRITIAFNKDVNDPNLLCFKKQLANCF